MMLLLVLVYGREVGGNRSWLVFGPLRLQPSEFAKLAAVLLLARLLASVNRPHLRVKELAVAAVIAFYLGLMRVMLQCTGEQLC